MSKKTIGLQNGNGKTVIAIRHIQYFSMTDGVLQIVLLDKTLETRFDPEEGEEFAQRLRDLIDGGGDE